MKQVFLVFLGGGVGSASRFLLGRWLNRFEHAIPYGTFLANILGSLLIGFLLGYFSKSTQLNENQTLLLATGFCGGFTTFSAFAFENHIFLKNGDYLSFFSYTTLTIVIGFMAVFFGWYLAKFV